MAGHTSDKVLPPPSYEQVTGGRTQFGLPPRVPLTYVDFWPVCTTPEQKLKRAEFETFEVLVQKANQWLSRNINFQVKKCETLMKKVNSFDDIYNGNMYYKSGGTTLCIYGLRLWLGERTDLDGRPEQIGVMSFMPVSLTPGQFTNVKSAQFENLGETYNRVNGYLLQNPLQGKILTVETVFLRLGRHIFKDLQGNVDPNQTAWYDHIERVRIGTVRIYFILGEAVYEEIGAADFLPDLLREPGLLSGMKYTDISVPIQKASVWLQSNQGVRFLSLQTLDVEYHQTRDPHLQSMTLFESKLEAKTEVAFIRVHYAKPRGAIVAPPTVNLTAPLSYKTFLPVLYAADGCCGSDRSYEDVHQTMVRVIAWLNAVRAPVVTVETIGRIHADAEDRKYGSDGTIVSNEWYTTTDSEGRTQGPYRHNLMYYIRVYLAGTYTEPPAEVLPPVPVVDESCTIL
ncbi:uncharacterized protein LOC106158515 [Lingula anatina]|uniref:Uncharacterized protein LOC106158515 n=1 Tax=Lingula anatina TaxID=7574 RepID=A0A1S3HVC9_LINAN|nr:uncharacterized protein LOC106158515 [Lingula anatina]|eukprot:XP_013389997.1 uncharacterized protein LOC106158515 [Lingula anatina]